ncbi:VIT family protein [Anaerolinea sp.]|uniref:VIT1/CCC1 transporter family protein n=1 Tax=Anaerolinea sp. TaxID=1872519 RepID=UPI002ACDB930|nr:VIT family protein [Anaerolinea sp.]
MPHREYHYTDRIGWIRAAVLGANDGIVSIASLLMGVAAAGTGHSGILIAGVAGLVAGAMSMAAGEYVSVSSQSDTEKADLARERAELAADPAAELEELTQIYVQRGLDEALARQVAMQLSERNAFEAHARDELGMSEVTVARPVQAALTSALAFSAGGILPVLSAVIAPVAIAPLVIPLVSLIVLASLGALSASLGGAPVGKSVLRVTFWGAIAMAITAGIGKLFGISA